MTKPRSNVIPFVDYRDRWPVDFSAARDSGAEAAQAELPEPRLPDFIAREVAAHEREARLLARARVFAALFVIGVLLAAFAYATQAVLELTDPLEPLHAEQPLNP